MSSVVVELSEVLVELSEEPLVRSSLVRHEDMTVRLKSDMRIMYKTLFIFFNLTSILFLETLSREFRVTESLKVTIHPISMIINYQYISL